MRFLIYEMDLEINDEVFDFWVLLKIDDGLILEMDLLISIETIDRGILPPGGIYPPSYRGVVGFNDV